MHEGLHKLCDGCDACMHVHMSPYFQKPAELFGKHHN